MNNKNEMLKIIFISDTRDIVNNFIGDYPNQGFLVDTKGKNPYYHYEFIKLYLKYHCKNKKLVNYSATR